MFWRPWRSLLKIVPCTLLIVGCSQGCSQIQIPSVSIQPKPLKEVDLNWQVTPVLQSGAYRVSGQMNLPDRTQLTVAALRYLYPATTAQSLSTSPTYAILDYQSAVIEQGTWQTQLNLWQVAPDGTFQESWQLDQRRLKTQFNPREKVVFLVTLAPIADLTELRRQLASQGEEFTKGIHSTSEGDLYAQSRRTLTVPLPQGSTIALPPQLEAENFGWGRRYLIPQEPQDPTQLERPSDHQTNAPVRPEQFLR